MASGKLGVAAPAAETYTAVYTVPPGKVATLNISIVNRGGSDIAARVALADGLPPPDENFVEYEALVPPSGVLERTALVAGAGESVIVYVTGDACSVRVFGFEESA